MLKIVKYEMPPADVHDAVCAEVIFFDEEEEKKVEGKVVKRMAQKIRFCFELRATQKDGKRFVISMGAEFYASLNAGNKLGKFLQAWSGSKTPLSDEQLEEWSNGINKGKVVGSNCRLNVIQRTGASGRDYAVITAILPKSEGSEKMTISADYKPWAERQKNWDNETAHENKPVPAPVNDEPKDKGMVPF